MVGDGYDGFMKPSLSIVVLFTRSSLSSSCSPRSERRLLPRNFLDVIASYLQSNGTKDPIFILWEIHTGVYSLLGKTWGRNQGHTSKDQK